MTVTRTKTFYRFANWGIVSLTIRELQEDFNGTKVWVRCGCVREKDRDGYSATICEVHDAWPFKRESTDWWAA